MRPLLPEGPLRGGDVVIGPRVGPESARPGLLGRDSVRCGSACLVFTLGDRLGVLRFTAGPGLLGVDRFGADGVLWDRLLCDGVLCERLFREGVLCERLGALPRFDED